MRQTVPPLSLVLVGVLALLFLSGCKETPTETPVIDVVAQYAKGGGKPPSVDATVPDEGEQDTTLDVSVLGSGFDDGSEVTFLLNEVPTETVTTNSTTFVTGSELRANITISGSAAEDLYDVEVMTKRGKRGVGVEMFRVRKKGEAGPTVNVTVLGGTATTITSGPDGANVRISGTIDESPAVWTSSAGWRTLPLRYPEDTYFVGFTGPGVATMNEAGKIIGTRWVRSDNFEGVFWSSISDQDIALPNPTQGRVVSANAINEAGQIVGNTFDHPGEGEDARSRAMLWTPLPDGTYQGRDLHSESFAQDYVNSVAHGINDRGQIVGRAFDGANERAFLWEEVQGGSQVTILDSSAGTGSAAYVINNANPAQIVGNLWGDDSGYAVWTVLPDGTVQTVRLPANGHAHDINDAGQVLGSLNNSGNSDKDLLTVWTVGPAGVTTLTIDEDYCGGGIDNSAPPGMIRVLGCREIKTGKGKKATSAWNATLIEIEPSG